MKHPKATSDALDGQYRSVFGEVAGILDAARRSAARSVNAVMTAAYWLIGRYIVEFEQSGEDRAEYGTKLIRRLSEDLTHRFGRGFGAVNLSQMKKFYLLWPSERILQTASEKSPSPAAQQADSAILQTASEKSEPMRLQQSLFPEWDAGPKRSIRGRGRTGILDGHAELQAVDATTLDRVHAAMLLQAHGHANALRALIKAEQGRGPDFLRLANALSALYPRVSREKRLLDAMLLAVPR